jgi:hypothetical protein
MVTNKEFEIAFDDSIDSFKDWLSGSLPENINENTGRQFLLIQALRKAYDLAFKICLRGLDLDLHKDNSLTRKQKGEIKDK